MAFEKLIYVLNLLISLVMLIHFALENDDMKLSKGHVKFLL